MLKVKIETNETKMTIPKENFNGGGVLLELGEGCHIREDAVVELFFKIKPKGVSADKT